MALFSVLSKVIFAIRQPKKIILFLLSKQISAIIPSKLHILILYRLLLNKKLNLKHPLGFNEKLQWLKLNDRNDLYTKLVDKYYVRNHIANIIGEKYLVTLIAMYEKVEDIDYKNLPNQFVLKPTHTSGDIIICQDKTNFDVSKANAQMRRWLKKNYYWPSREYPYKNIEPKILCEELLIDDIQNELIDYKILCFNGVPKCLFLCLDRRSQDGLKVDFYDLDWNLLPFERHFPNSGRIIKKPDCLGEMLELSKKLSKDFPFVRVDFYVVKNQIKFGELTFYPGSGFEEFTPEAYDFLLGSWLDLSSLDKKIE